MPLTVAVATLALALQGGQDLPGEPPDPGEPHPAPVAPSPPPAFHSLGVSAGPVLGRVYDLTLAGGSARLAWRHAWTSSPEVGIGVEVGGQAALLRTPERLRVTELQAGALLWVGGRARFGLGFDLGTVTVERVTPGSALRATQLMPHAMLSVDVLRLRTADVTVELHASGMFLDVNLYTGQALVGARF
jgi:hypothetical protein